MLYFSEQLSDGRYGIYINGELAAYISRPETCKKLVEGLKSKLSEANKAKISEDAKVMMSYQKTKVAS